jgi:hypothetical protein
VDDEAGVPGRHPPVDDVGVEPGQVQRGDGLHDLQDHDPDQEPAVRAQVLAQQGEQHEVQV